MPALHLPLQDQKPRVAGATCKRRNPIWKTCWRKPRMKAALPPMLSWRGDTSKQKWTRRKHFCSRFFKTFFESFLPTSQIGRWHVVDKVRRIRQRLHKTLGGVLSKSEFSDAMECFKILEAQLVWKNEDEHDDLLHHQAVTASLVHVVIHVVALCCLCCFADIWGSAPRMKR